MWTFSCAWVLTAMQRKWMLGDSQVEGINENKVVGVVWDAAWCLAWHGGELSLYILLIVQIDVL